MDPEFQLQPHFLQKVPSLWVVLGLQLSQGSVYELWCHNNQAQTNLTFNLGTTYQTTYSIPTSHHLHQKELLAQKAV